MPTQPNSLPTAEARGEVAATKMPRPPSERREGEAAPSQPRDSRPPGHGQRVAELVSDLSHGPVIMLAVKSAVGNTYIDGSRPDSDVGAGIEIGRSDGYAIEVTTPEEADALIDAIRVVRREVWG
jgi:hypothetical protein